MSHTTPAAGAQPAPPAAATVALIAAAALTILDVSKVGVALPVIQTALGDGRTGEVALQLMMIGYTVAYAVFLLPSGRLGDIVSRKKMFLWGLIVFIAASLICALAVDATMMVAGRIIQGAGAGILMPQVVGLIQRMYVPADRGRPLAALAVTTALTSALAPVLAGVMIDVIPGDMGWRSLFWMNVVVGAVALPAAWKTIRDIPGESRPGYDWPGALLLAAAIGLVVMPLGTISGGEPLAWWFPVSIVLGIVCTALFMYRERAVARHAGEPLLDLTLFRRHGFSTGLIIAGLMHATGTSSALIMTLYLQQAAKLTPLQTALAMVFSAAFVSVSSSLTGRMRVQRAWSLIWVGATVSTVSMALVAATMGFASTALAVPLLVGLWAINGIGTGMISAPNQSRTLARVPDYRASVAGSAIQLVQRVGSALGMALAMIVYFSLGNGTGGGGSPGAGAALGLCALYLTGVLVTARIEQRGAAKALAE